MVGFVMYCTNSRAVRLFVILLITSFLSIASMIHFSFDGFGDGTGDFPPPATGDWIVTSDTYVHQETLTVNGNLTIEDGGKLTLDNTTLIVNGSFYGDLWINVENGGELNVINNSRIKEGTLGVNYDFVFESGSSGIISESVITDCGWDDGESYQSSGGILIVTDDVIIANSSIHQNYMGIVPFGVSPIIENNDIRDNIKYGILLINSSSRIIGNKISTNPVGIYGIYSDPELVNNEIFDNGDGARFYYSSITMEGGKFTSNSPDDCTSGTCSSQESGKGFLTQASNLTMNNVEVSDNSRGAVVQYTIVEISNSTFSDNSIDGLSGEYVEADLVNNEFKNNARYGIKWMYNPLNVDSTNTFSENNGEARIVLEWDVSVSVTDSNGDWVGNTRVDFEGSGNGKFATTNIVGTVNLPIAQYIIENDGSKTDFNPYTITAKKVASWNQVEYKNSTTLDITQNTDVDLVIPLKKPDLEIKEIRFSETPKKDSSVDIKIDISNNGEANANNVSLVVTSKDSNGKSKIVTKSTFSIDPNQDITLSIPWTPEGKGEISISAELDDTKNIKETNEDNNELEVIVDVAQGDAPLFEDAYIAASMIAFLIIAVGILIYIITLRKKVEKKEE
jgi:hypothetical protein